MREAQKGNIVFVKLIQKKARTKLVKLKKVKLIQK